MVSWEHVIFLSNFTAGQWHRKQTTPIYAPVIKSTGFIPPAIYQSSCCQVLCTGPDLEIPTSGGGGLRLLILTTKMPKSFYALTNPAHRKIARGAPILNPKYPRVSFDVETDTRTPPPHQNRRKHPCVGRSFPVNCHILKKILVIGSRLQTFPHHPPSAHQHQPNHSYHSSIWCLCKTMTAMTRPLVRNRTSLTTHLLPLPHKKTPTLLCLSLQCPRPLENDDGCNI